MFITIIRKIPKKRNRWVFGSRFGERYDENSKYIFEYVSTYHHNMQAIWITSNEIVYAHLKKNNLAVYYLNSIQGWYYSLTASVAFISVCYRDINRYSISGAKVVQLWHGTPMRNNNLANLNEYYEMVTVASQEYLTNGFLGSPHEFDFILTGYPKNDGMLSTIKYPHIENLLYKYDRKKIIMYLPTHRQRCDDEGNLIHIQEFDLFEYGFDFDLLESKMFELDALFIMKLHPLQEFKDPSMLERIEKSKNIHLVDSQNPLEDVYEYLKYVDVLVTDYSSVYFDYLLLDRPIIFAIFDYDSQLSVRSFRFDMDDVLIGSKVFSWGEMISEISLTITEGDKWKETREIINKRFNYYQDAGSSKRVYQEVLSRLSRL